MNTRIRNRAIILIAAMVTITNASTYIRADTGTCGGASVTLPFTDVPSGNIFFCSIAEAYFSGLTNGTTPTTYNPGDLVTREQMAAFVTRTMDQSLKRGSRRAALKQFWTPTSADDLGLSGGLYGPVMVESDGADLWIADPGMGQVTRARASDGKWLETYIAAHNAFGVLAAKGLIFVTGDYIPGVLYQINPRNPGAAITLSSALGNHPRGIAFDGARIWTANAAGSVSIVTLNPITVTNVTAGFTSPMGILYDGANMWVTDFDADKLFKLDSNGAIIQSITVGRNPSFPVFDGTNIWVPNRGWDFPYQVAGAEVLPDPPAAGTVTVVRASTGAVLTTLTGNGLNGPFTAAFDGERILVTNQLGNSVSLWKAADLTPLGWVSTGTDTSPTGACSDGLNFWITLQGTPERQATLARF